MKSLSILITLLLALTGVVCAGPATEYQFVREFGQEGTNEMSFWRMDGIGVDRFGHVFVSDIYPAEPGWTGAFQCVKRWTTEGSYELFWLNNSAYEWEAEGLDCSCDGDPFYVAPDFNDQFGILGSKIEHTDPVGMFYESFPPDPEFKLPFEYRDVAVSADGAVYGIMYSLRGPIPEADRADGIFLPYDIRVTKFEWDGTQWNLIRHVRVSNEFEMSKLAWGIDVDPWRDRVYVTVLDQPEIGVAGVKVYDTDLELIENRQPWTGAAMPYGVAVDNRNGNYLVCEGTANVVERYDPDGTLQLTLGGPGSAPAEFNRPSDLDVDMHGWLYVADADNHRVQIFAPPRDGNLNFIVRKAKLKVNWKQKAKGKHRDVIVAKGIAAVDVYTNLFGLPAQPMVGMPASLYFDDLAIIAEMVPTKTDKKGLKALYRPDKNHKMKLIYRPRGALILVKAKLKRGNIDGPLGINDEATLPPWEWVTAQLTLSNEYLGVHYMRMEHVNKVGKKYKAIKK